jgi:phosphoribosyl 1,2-cyclic phosphodiesterase
VPITFLGTRGEIRVRSRLHRRHSCIIVERGKARVVIDCGADWLHLISRVSPTAILLTHAHPDHAGGVAHGASCPVYAPARTWRSLPAWPVFDRRLMPLQKSTAIAGISFGALPVEHSIRAPAIGYRVSANRVRFFYVPDAVRLRNRRRTLRGIDLYVGDGASITRPIIRRRGRAAIGHSSIRVQLDWCTTERVGIAYFTHCGSEIVTAHARPIHQAVRRLGAERGVDAQVARDGLRLILGGGKLHFVAPAAVARSKTPRYRSCPSHARR